jgi:hypothetical protein
MAFIFWDVFDEYTFHPEPQPAPRVRAQPEGASIKAKSKMYPRQSPNQKTMQMTVIGSIRLNLALLQLFAVDAPI